MKPYLVEYKKRLTQLNDRISSEFGNLSPEQFNWKPSEKDWSVGQCIDHVVVTTNLYYSIFDSMLAGQYKGNFWQKIPVLPSVWGNMIKGFTNPTAQKKTKTAPLMEPAQSDVALQVIDDFKRNHTALSEYIDKMQHLDLEHTIISSPIASMITYNLKDALTILVNHADRHLNQASNVIARDNFPR